jgi:hypothetical protein
MQCSVRKSGVKLGVERHVRRAHLEHVESGRPSNGDQLGRIVDPDYIGPALDDLVSQRTIAAADVEDPLARLRIEQVERRLPKVSDKAPDPGIVRSVPAAGRGDRRRQSVFTQSR